MTSVERIGTKGRLGVNWKVCFALDLERDSRVDEALGSPAMLRGADS